MPYREWTTEALVELVKMYDGYLEQPKGVADLLSYFQGNISLCDLFVFFFPVFFSDVCDLRSPELKKYSAVQCYEKIQDLRRDDGFAFEV